LTISIIVASSVTIACIGPSLLTLTLIAIPVVVPAVLDPVTPAILTQVLNPILLPFYTVTLTLYHITTVVVSSIVAVISIAAIPVPVIAIPVIAEHRRWRAKAPVVPAAACIANEAPVAASPLVSFTLGVDYPGTAGIAADLYCTTRHATPVASEPLPDFVSAAAVGSTKPPAIHLASADESGTTATVAVVVCKCPGKRQGEQYDQNHQSAGFQSSPTEFA